MPLKLFTTSSCHLCEEAESLLLSLAQTQHFTRIEIANNDTLTELYGHRIPVLQRTDNFSELNWPFTENDIIKLIEDY